MLWQGLLWQGLLWQGLLLQGLRLLLCLIGLGLIGLGLVRLGLVRLCLVRRARLERRSGRRLLNRHVAIPWLAAASRRVRARHGLAGATMGGCLLARSWLPAEVARVDRAIGRWLRRNRRGLESSRIHPAATAA